MERVHPTLRAIYEEMAPNKPHPDQPLGHAEVKATNELLWARTRLGPPDDVSVLKEIRTSVEFPFMKDRETGTIGRGAPFCSNCYHMLPGVPSPHGRFTGYELDSVMNSVRRVDADDPDVDIDMGHRTLYRGELFTGEMAEYQGEQVVCLDVYLDGIRNGLSQMWYPDGTPKLRGNVVNGSASGEFLEWHPNGALKSRKFFDDNIYSLKEETVWDEHGDLVREWRREEG